MAAVGRVLRWLGGTWRLGLGAVGGLSAIGLLPGSCEGLAFGAKMGGRESIIGEEEVDGLVGFGECCCEGWTSESQQRRRGEPWEWCQEMGRVLLSLSRLSTLLCSTNR